MQQSNLTDQKTRTQGPTYDSTVWQEDHEMRMRVTTQPLVLCQLQSPV